VRIERQTYLGAGPYERTPERRGRANGFKAKKITPALAGGARETRMGEIAFDVPQGREGGFYPGALEKRLRSERALTLALAEVYVQGVQLVISDDHTRLENARRAVLGGVPWQRGQFHLQQNASQYVPRKSMRKEVPEDIRTIFNAPDRPTAEAYLARAVAKYARTASRLSAWMEESLPEGFTVFSFPKEHWRRLRTTNGLERISQEIKRRTRVVRIFPNEAACMRLVSAILMEISEEWETGKVYLTMDDDE
jgi:transposase-like protein